jgi:putative flippase GtrA
MVPNMTEWLQEFLSRDAGPFAQFVKYVIGGGIATATHIGIFHLLGWRLLPCLEKRDWAVQLLNLRVVELDDKARSRNSMFANGGAFLVSNMVAYLVNIMWVFHPGKHSRIVEIGLFYLVSGVSIVLGTSLMGWLIRKYGMRTTYAFISNLVSALFINYAMRRFVIFNG